MELQELKERGIMNFINSEEGVQRFQANKEEFYATIGKMLEDEGVEVLPEDHEDEEQMVQESFKMVSVSASEQKAFGGRFWNWVKKGMAFVQRMLKKLMSWFCDNSIVQDLRSENSQIREKAVEAIYKIACEAFPRFCKYFGKIFRKAVAYLIKGLTKGILDVVCPEDEKSIETKVFLNLI